ncbi:hypothetical protein HCG51_00870 [Tolypothrix sp. PCC 7910]|uniref:hypothetical protein n=1 Tax=Tolypothrix sp. PCC 7910 TaxID=2099387 RepID=UPI0014277289|nr:hypothetical protein [Tolypothrix sp. PCC 7910]QIR35441.1 hypothetical protein HCG51_00870 [Tolypothrix sp. PCC 7910]
MVHVLLREFDDNSGFGISSSVYVPIVAAQLVDAKGDRLLFKFTSSKLHKKNTYR